MYVCTYFNPHKMDPSTWFSAPSCHPLNSKRRRTLRISTKISASLFFEGCVRVHIMQTMIYLISNGYLGCFHFFFTMTIVKILQSTSMYKMAWWPFGTISRRYIFGRGIAETKGIGILNRCFDRYCQTILQKDCINSMNWLYFSSNVWEGPFPHVFTSTGYHPNISFLPISQVKHDILLLLWFAFL